MFSSRLYRQNGPAAVRNSLSVPARAFHSPTPARVAKHAAGSTASGPLEQIRRVKQLQTHVSSVNSKSVKESIIGEYPDLRHLLEHVYDPNHRTHLSSSSLQKYATDHLATTSNTTDNAYNGPSSITDLFDALSSRKVTGNAAKALVMTFLAHHGIREEADVEVFHRLLDRNLVAGFGARTLMQVQWEDSQTEKSAARPSPPSRAESMGTTPRTAPLRGSVDDTESAAVTPGKGQPSTPARRPTSSRSLKAFSCALGKTILPPFTPLFKGGVTWYASRKLDGVRCITFFDFDVSDPHRPKIAQIQHLSRTGKPFFTLGNLGPQLSLIQGYPGLGEMLKKDPEVIDDPDNKGRVIKRLVLDGEVCVMVPSPTAPATAPQPTGSSDAMSPTASTQLWTETGLIEDFPSTVSEMRRQHHTIARPAYYLFDLLSCAEFEANSSLPNLPGLGKTFSGRLADLQDLSSWLSGQTREGDALMVRALNQQVVEREEDVEGMVDTAAGSGWEGLVLRADKGYVGKRSTDVRKFKQWQDAEYIVTDVDISRQRLAVDGVFDEYDAVAAVNIRHKGHQVAVGSGLTAEQRIRWARDPSQIAYARAARAVQELIEQIGKQITVEYFAESEAQGRQGTMSLRFPRIKTVWDGKRDV